MGGNGSYIPSRGGVPVYNRTHDELDRRIDGHKILIQKESPQQIKVPMNSNSENPIYICGRVNKETKVVEIVSIGIYKDHKLVKSIDLEYDKKGNLIPFKKGEKSSHQHDWNTDVSGDVGRKSRKPDNHHQIDPGYMHLVHEVDAFNKEKNKWKKS